MATNNKPIKVCIIVGEASGDSLGVTLIHDLKTKNPNIEFMGIAGSLMKAQGMESLFPMEDLSVMGIAEIFPQIPKLLKRIKQTVAAVEVFQPDYIVTIDAPDFSKRVVKRLRKNERSVQAKFIHYVAPTVWAWRPKRAKLFAKLYDAIFCLFPFEPPYFEKEGMAAYFVGHPVVKEKLHGNDKAQTLGVFYGSRLGELQRSGAVLTATAKNWLAKHPQGTLIVPTLSHMLGGVKEQLSDVTARCEFVVGQKKQAFAQINKAIAVSGTIGLELAVAGIPHLIAYKTNALTYWIVKSLVKVKYAHLANLILDEPIVPEYLQDDCTIENMTSGLESLDIQKQKHAFKKLEDVLNSDLSAADCLLTL
jgi:lipid-A-disaccharide synthase